MKVARLIGMGFVCVLTGAFLCNGVPHFVSGLLGQRFPSPFANPPGLGESSSLVNMLWGLFNLTVGALLWKAGKFTLGLNWQTCLVWLAVLGMGVGLSTHFESARYGEPGAARSAKSVPGFGHTVETGPD